MNIKLQAIICVALCSTSLAQTGKPSREAAGKVIRGNGHECKTVVSVALVHPDGERFRVRCGPGTQGKFSEYFIWYMTLQTRVFSCTLKPETSECSYRPIAEW
jgi:hypothetical protein